MQAPTTLADSFLRGDPRPDRALGQAVRAGDMAGVLADHADGIVMFDVPPPERGARGLDEYAATWPDFFTWLSSGALFDIDELEVTAGADAAFAHALLG